MKNLKQLKENEDYLILSGKMGEEIYVLDRKVGGYTAYFKDFPKMVTQGETMDEAQECLWNTLYDTLKYFFKDKKQKN